MERIRFEGVKAVDPATLRVCLATHEREAVELGLSGLMKPKCGEPPFDNKRASARLWSWPWKDWPVYDEAVLKLDIQRIERWYQARGYYAAHVTNVEFKPPEMNNDEPCKKNCEGEIIITVSEGEPVRIRSIAFQGLEALTPEVREDIEKDVANELKVGSIFDEALYARAKENVASVLREAGYARAKVEGKASVHRGLLFADVAFKVAPGPVCTFGDVRVVTSADNIPTDVVLAVAKLKPGTRYSESELREAQHAVYAMGAFASVRVRGDFESDPSASSIPVLIEVSPRRESEIMVGIGIMSGVLATGPMAQEYVSVPQWDVHLIGSYANRNFFGGLRQFRIEERPRMLFLDAFPRVPDNSPQFANFISQRFSQPGVIEPRTTLFLEDSWDYGPDPFQLFFRHEVANAIGLERGFLEGRLHVRVAAHYEFQEPTKRQPIGEVTRRWREAEDWLQANPTCADNPNAPGCEEFTNLWIEPSGYHLPFIEERITLDLRDDGVMPKKGGYFSMGLHQAIPAGDRSWAYLRITPDFRAYAPLGLGFVLAARFALGSIHIFRSGEGLDIESERLGPQTYRLRGGGANGNRGFGPGQLGDGLRGGIRRWESSLELRIPLAANFSLAAFGDMGDVHANDSFRFNHLNTAVGGGLRYRTIIGPIRLDVGYRPKKLQRADGGKGEDDKTDLGFAKFPGAIHLTIGESF